MMKCRLCMLAILVLALSTSVFALPGMGFYNIGNGTSTGISDDAKAIAYNLNGVSYLYNVETGASYAINASGNNVGISHFAGTDQYGIVYNYNNRAWTWKGTLDGVGTTTGDPYSGTYVFTARNVAGRGDATQIYVAGSESASGKSAIAARWKAPGGSVASYSAPSTFWSDLYYLYGASYSGIYSGWGRLSSSGSVANKSQAMVLEGGALVSLRNGWGAPSIDYYSCAYISGDGQTCFGYTGASDNSTAVACYWNRSEYGAFTTNTTCNLIPFLPGYAKAYAMESDADASVIAGWTIKPAGEWGVDRRTIFLFDKATGTVRDLRQVLASMGVDMSAWGLMDVTGISADGSYITGTMLPATDTYWTTGTVQGPYSSFLAVIPEPSSLSVLALGALGLLGLRRRK